MIVEASGVVTGLFPAQPVHPTEQYVIISGEQGTEPPPPPPGVTSIPTLTSHAQWQSQI